MNLFERWLTLWVALCIVAGIALGHMLPGLFGARQIAYLLAVVADQRPECGGLADKLLLSLR